MPIETKRSIIIAVIILFLGAALYTGLVYLKTPPEKKEGELLRSLRVLPLNKETIIPKVDDFAVVESLDEINIKAEVAGKVIRCDDDITDGVNVKKGDLLIQIEKADYEIARQEAEADLEILKADKKNLEQNVKDMTEILSEVKMDYEIENKNYNRIKNLFERKVSSRSELEKAQQYLSMKKKAYIETNTQLSKDKFSLESVKGKIKKAQAMFEKAELNLRRSSVKAPIDGRIGDFDIEIGEYLTLGEKICTITNDAKPSLKVPVDVDEASKILHVRPGKKLWLIMPDSVKVVVSWEKKPDVCKWYAKVSRVENYDSETDTLRILVEPTRYAGNRETPFHLITGMFCQVEFLGVPIENAFKIPFSALQFDNNVYTVNKKGILSRHKVDPFAVYGDYVIILSGLPENEMVVIQQLPRGLINGMKVKALLPRKKN